MRQPVCLVMLALNRRALAVIAGLPAVHGTSTIGRHGAVLRGGGAVGCGPFTVTGPAPRDLSARVIDLRGPARRELTITFLAELIALGRGSIAAVTARITTGGCAGAPRDARAAVLRVAFTRLAHELVKASVAAGHEIAIARALVHVRGGAISVGGGLVGIGGGLLAVAQRLLGIGQRLLTISAPLVVSQPLDRCGIATRSRRAGACEIHGTTA